MQAYSAEHLDYLQRVGRVLAPPPTGTSWTIAPPALRRLDVIRAVGMRDRRHPEPMAIQADKPPRLPSEDLLAGLHSYRILVAFLVRGGPEGISVALGNWSPGGRPTETPQLINARQGLVKSLLNTIFVSVEAEPAVDVGEWSPAPYCGLAMGVPSNKSPDTTDPVSPLDRLIRTVGPARWAFLVLAQPLDEPVTVDLRRRVINEVREVASAEMVQQAERAFSPLAEHYLEQLTALQKMLTVGQSVGVWRTAVYLTGDATGYPRLSAAWRAVHSGEASVPEPIRVHDLGSWPEADRARAVNWGLPDTEAEPGPGLYRHLFEYQTVLTSSQLASFIHLPQEETTGFELRLVPAFDAVRPPIMGPSVAVGKVILRDRPTKTTYAVERDSLTHHVLVAGMTGAGKSTTIFHILEQIAATKIPFLVIEPAKAEYRSLLTHREIGSRIRVFTLGDEQTSPYRLNPFEVPDGVKVSLHLDLLRSVFGASFGMWAPLPQVLEQCLHEIYLDRGWDLTTDENRRLDEGADRTLAFPTLTDLVAKVTEVVPRLGYEDRIRDNIRAALVTRLESLRRGEKGRMLDVRRSFPMDKLLGEPTILELEAMGDEDDRAFLMALLLVRLYERRLVEKKSGRIEGQKNRLRHLLVIEEAHRLLSAPPQPVSEEQGDARGKAVETFAELLREIRAYGQGVLIADQSPVTLAADVIKNTDLKIAHKIVAEEDRAKLAGAMDMDERESRWFTNLKPGQAAVFGQGDDIPILVTVPAPPEELRMPTDHEVAERTSAWRAENGLPEVFEVSPFCAETCDGAPWACEAARRLTGDEVVQATFSRMVLSTIEESGALDRLWDDFVTVVRPRRPARLDEGALLRSLAGHLSDWYANRRGAQASWSYSATDELSAMLRHALLEKIDRGGVSESSARAQFRRYARKLHHRDFAPYPACDRVCDQADGPLCLYRLSVADLIATGRLQVAWREAAEGKLEDGEAAASDSGWEALWEVCKNASYEIIEYPDTRCPEDVRSVVDVSFWRAGLCFAQQMLSAEGKVPWTSRRDFDLLWPHSFGKEST